MCGVLLPDNELVAGNAWNAVSASNSNVKEQV